MIGIDSQVDEMLARDEKLDLKAEQIEKELFEDYDVFSTWLADEFAPTADGVKLHNAIIEFDTVKAGIGVMMAYKAYCVTEAYIKARSETGES